MIRNAATSLALAALFVAQAASAATSTAPCLDRKQAEDLVTFSLPVLVDGVAERCRATLSTSAFLLRGDPGARYAADADAAWPAAQGTLTRLFGNITSGFLTEEIQRTVLEQAVTAALVSKVAVKDCATIDRALTALAPLPGRNVAQTVVIAYDLFSRSRDDLPFKLCEVAQ
ncbi:hypothetical protein [Sphingomonas sp. ID0503]|uniref:hypothetical protein n=1 Tax=Sphingomonas sp. ID0503 TaxID=3399691 RepID=UPI003AFB254F